MDGLEDGRNCCEQTVLGHIAVWSDCCFIFKSLISLVICYACLYFLETVVVHNVSLKKKRFLVSD